MTVLTILIILDITEADGRKSYLVSHCMVSRRIYEALASGEVA